MAPSDVDIHIGDGSELTACPDCGAKPTSSDEIMPGFKPPDTLRHEQGCRFYQVMFLSELSAEIAKQAQERQAERNRRKRQEFRRGPMPGTWVYQPSSQVVTDRDTFLDSLEAARADARRDSFRPLRPLGIGGTGVD